MKSAFIIIVVAICASWVMPAKAYEVATHGAMARESFSVSILQDQSYTDSLGLDIAENDLGNKYYNVIGPNVVERMSQSFENKIIDRLGGEPQSLQGWVMRGAIREDDICPPFAMPSHCDGPTDEIRVLNHFFDPVNDRPLTIGLPIGERATDWGSGFVNTYSEPPSAYNARGNHYSWVDAIESMFRALTGRSTSGADDIGPGNTVADESVRKGYWATMFRSLGDMLHIVQDMAQPQHTRNDTHIVDGKINKKAYEGYTNDRVLDNRIKCFDGQETDLAGIDYAGYPEVRLDRLRSFLSTSPGSQAGVMSGTGIADYSNRGFFTAGSNVGNTDYTSPPTTNIESNYQKDSSSYGNGCLPGEYIFVPTVVYRRAVADTYDFSYNAQNVALTAEGIWTKKFLGTLGYEDKGYGLARVNYDEVADLLIPRAVSYGAGVIDYFFRGRIKVLNVREDMTTGGAPAYRVTVKNVSEYPVPTATVFSDGTFSFYYKALDQNSNSIMQPLTVLNSTDPQDGNDPHLDSAATFAPNDTLEFLLSVPAGDWDRTQSPAMVAVFNGQIGLEPGIAAYVFSPPGLIAVEPVQDTAGRGVFRSYLADHDGNTWALQPEFRPNDGGANNYTLSKAEYLGKQTLVGFGYTNPLGTGTYIRTRYSSDNLGQSWQTSPSTLPARIITLAGLKSYNFEHLEFVESATLATIGVPVSATQTGNDFYSDYEVYLSTDAGQTWSVAGTLTGIYYPGEIVYTGMNGALPTFALLAGYQDPVEGLRVGFYRTTDGGQNWVRENDDVFSNSVAHDSISFTGPDANYHLVWLGNDGFLMNYTRYVPNGTSGVAEYHNEFYHSTDNGNSWTMRSEVPEPNDDGDPLTIGEVKTLQYLGGDRLFAYVTHEQYLNSYPWNAGYISSDGGMTWTPFNPGLPLDVNTAVTPNYHTNIYRPFIGALDNGAVPGQYDVP